MVLIEEDCDADPPDYQSPKFTIDPKRPPDSHHTTAHSPPDPLRRSTLERPYGHSILALSELLPLLPSSLQPAYQQVHRKLITDQILAEERLHQQETTIGVLLVLRQLQKD